MKKTAMKPAVATKQTAAQQDKQQRLALQEMVRGLVQEELGQYAIAVTRDDIEQHVRAILTDLVWEKLSGFSAAKPINLGLVKGFSQHIGRGKRAARKSGKNKK